MQLLDISSSSSYGSLGYDLVKVGNTYINLPQTVYTLATMENPISLNSAISFVASLTGTKEWQVEEYCYEQSIEREVREHLDRTKGQRLAAKATQHLHHLSYDEDEDYWSTAVPVPELLRFEFTRENLSTVYNLVQMDQYIELLALRYMDYTLNFYLEDIDIFEEEYADYIATPLKDRRIQALQELLIDFKAITAIYYCYCYYYYELEGYLEDCENPEDEIALLDWELQEVMAAFHSMDEPIFTAVKAIELIEEKLNQ
ncbi:hypothetical protein [Vibrio harveyi]|uniref:hypothetical protein n=1 Tax=Vibrio harveyi TaxID=669 RepID=UPI00390A6945